jgi:hypothetical protein
MSAEAHSDSSPGEHDIESAFPEITLFVKEVGSLSKELSIDEVGNLVKGSNGLMVSGKAFRCILCDGGDPALDLGQFLADMKPNQAIALGRLRDGIGEYIDIVTERHAKPLPAGPIARTAENFQFKPEEPAFLLVDVDTKHAPQNVRDRLAHDGIEGILGEVLPEIAVTSRVWRASTSAGLSAGGKPIGDAGGAHLYILVADGADIGRSLKVLAARLWLAGYGWIALSRSGAMLERSPVDTAVGGAERLVFEGAPTLGPGLEQDQEARRPKAVAGSVLDIVALKRGFDLYWFPERVVVEFNGLQEAEARVSLHVLGGEESVVGDDDNLLMAFLTESVHRPVDTTSVIIWFCAAGPPTKLYQRGANWGEPLSSAQVCGPMPHLSWSGLHPDQFQNGFVNPPKPGGRWPGR